MMILGLERLAFAWIMVGIGLGVLNRLAGPP
jgi:hypothetical protein